ncbi:MAG TPA: restriction endonuclease [Longimicrobiales bacterium]
MSDPRALSASGYEILVARELRRVGIEPVGLRRRARGVRSGEHPEFAFDLLGQLEAYDRRWSALIGCSNRADAASAAEIDGLRARARDAKAASALLFVTSGFTDEAVRRAREQRVALLRIVDAHGALLARGLIQPGPLPAWVPELTVELVVFEDERVQTQPVAPNEPELVLRQLR